MPSALANSEAEEFLKEFRRRNSDQAEFIQSVTELVGSLGPVLKNRPDIRAARILERLTEPEHIFAFRVTWVNDAGIPQVNRGYRVQFSSALGPYKGGLRFHPSVNLSILKFLGFEQVFKNSLTGLSLGGAKGGADFNPKGKSEAEIMRFCQAFMTELANHIGPDKDIPAGDIGVGSLEIGYLFGWYKKLANEFHGSMTGKGPEWGGSNLRPEATGYGLLYFVHAMLAEIGQDLPGQTIVISGSGNVAQYAAEKAIELGARVLTLSDSTGYIHDPAGVTKEKLEFIKQLKGGRRGSIEAYAKEFDSATFIPGQPPWQVKANIYLPCATQNELNGQAAKTIIANDAVIVAEGANMPATPEAIEVFNLSTMLFAPGKASNAGGVAVSGLEMSQNSIRTSWSLTEIDDRLKIIMKDIHNKSLQYGRDQAGKTDYVKGANTAGFLRVADAMLAQGIT